MGSRPRLRLGGLRFGTGSRLSSGTDLLLSPLSTSLDADPSCPLPDKATLAMMASSGLVADGLRYFFDLCGAGHHAAAPRLRRPPADTRSPATPKIRIAPRPLRSGLHCSGRIGASAQQPCFNRDCLPRRRSAACLVLLISAAISASSLATERLLGHGSRVCSTSL